MARLPETILTVRSGANARILRWRRLLAAVSIGAVLGAGAQTQAVQAATPGAATTLQVERQGEAFVVQAQAEIDADLTTVWATLSDYDHLGDFIPGMSASRTLSRSGPDVVVEQEGSAAFGPFRRRFSVRLAVRETLYASIRAEGVGGDFRRFDSRYELEPLSSTRTRVVYRAQLAPGFAVPPLIGLPVMRSMMQEQFDALVIELQRRAGQRART